MNQTTTTATTAATQNKTGAMAEDIDSVKLKDVTNFMIDQLEPGEVMRFGEGWITLCKECKSVIILGSEFKTFASKNGQWRIAPSLACPKEDCDWHVSVVVEPEEEVEVESEAEEEAKDETEKEVKTVTTVTPGTSGVKA